MEKGPTTRTKTDEATIEQLQHLGLTPSESKIYIAAIERGTSTVTQLARATHIHRRNTYDSLNTLIDKGLMFQIIGEREGNYAAVHPSKLLELVQTKEWKLEAIMPTLKQRFESPSPNESATIYKGIEGFKKYLEDILATEQDVYCLGAKGGWASEELGEFASWFEQERIRKNIKVYNLFDYEMRSKISTKKPLYDALGEHRFLSKELSTNSALDVFGDRVVTFTGLYPERFDDDVTLFVLTNRDIAESFRIWFQCMWEAASST